MILIVLCTEKIGWMKSMNDGGTTMQKVIEREQSVAKELAATILGGICEDVQLAIWDDPRHASEVIDCGILQIASVVDDLVAQYPSSTCQIAQIRDLRLTRFLALQKGLGNHGYDG